MTSSQHENTTVKCLIAIALSIVVSACSTSTKQPQQMEYNVQSIPVNQSNHAAQLTQLLQAEFSLQRHGGKAAFPLYFDAAQNTNDASVSQRATSAAIASDNNDAVLLATQLWLEQDPKAAQAYPVRLQALLVDEQTKIAQELLTQCKKEGIALDFLPDFVDQNIRNNRIMGQLQTLLASNDLKDNVFVQTAKIHLDFAEGQYTSILQRIENILVQSSDKEAEALIVIKAFSLQQVGQNTLAQQTLEAGEQKYPNSQRIFANLLDIMIENQQSDAAIEKFHSAQLPLYLRQQIGLSIGQRLLQQGSTKQTIKIMSTLPRQGGLGYQINFVLANALHDNGQLDSALNTLSNVYGGLSWNASELVVKWLYNAKQPERINSIILQRTTKDNEPGHVIGVVDLHLQKQRKDLAYELLNQSLAALSDTDAIRYRRAIMHDQDGNGQAAISDLKILVEQHPNDASYLNALGYTIMVRTPDNMKEAIKLIEKAYALDPKDPAIIDSLGWAHYLQGDVAQANQLLSEAWSLMKDAEIGAHYGEVLWVMEDTDGAYDVWQRALEINDQLPTLRQTLQRYAPEMLTEAKDKQ